MSSACSWTPTRNIAGQAIPHIEQPWTWLPQFSNSQFGPPTSLASVSLCAWSAAGARSSTAEDRRAVHHEFRVAADTQHAARRFTDDDRSHRRRAVRCRASHVLDRIPRSCILPSIAPTAAPVCGSAWVLHWQWSSTTSSSWWLAHPDSEPRCFNCPNSMRSTVYLWNARASVRPSRATAAGLLLWARRAGHTGRLLHGRRSAAAAPKQRRPSVGSATFSVDVGSCTDFRFKACDLSKQRTLRDNYRNTIWLINCLS